MAENYTPIDVQTFVNDTSAVNTVNNNFAAISTAFTDVLSRSGVSPNQMTSPLDMNNNQIINLPPPSTANSPARLVDIAQGTITVVTATTGNSGHTVPFLDGTNTWSGVNTFTAGIIDAIVNPSSFTTNNLFNSVSVTGDNLDASGVGNVADAFAVYLGSGGSSTKGARQAFQSTFQLTSPTSSSNTSRNYVGGIFVSQAVSNDGGGVGTEKGSIFGGNSTGILNAAATNMSELCCHEFNTIANTGSTVLDKWGLSVVQTANDAVSGSRNDAAVRIVNQAGATNWKNGIQFGDGLNQYPIKTTGTLIKSVSGSAATGIDFSTTTFSGAAFSSNAFAVGSTGTIITGAGTVANGSIIFNGATSGNLNLTSNATATLLTLSQPMQIGVIGTTGGSLTLAGQTSGSAIISCAATAGTLLLGNSNASIDTSGNMVSTGNMKIGSTTAPIAGGDTGHAYFMSSTTNFAIYYGSGAPSISAAQGSLYMRTDGSTGVTRAYINTTGSNVWTAINTVA